MFILYFNSINFNRINDVDNEFGLLLNQKLEEIVQNQENGTNDTEIQNGSALELITN